MFAPNRMLTTKEQWLLVGIIVAVITGCATLYFHDTGGLPEHGGTTTIIPAKPQTVVAKSAGNAASAPVPPATARNEATEAKPAIASDPARNDVAAEIPPRPSPRIIGVAIMGAVARPNLYMVEEGLRVADLIALADGTTEHADLSDILLTASLVDETTLTIPELPAVTRDETQVAVRRRNTAATINPPMYRRSAAPAPAQTFTAQTPEIAPPPIQVSAPLPPFAAAMPAGLLNINYATSEQLQQLPGIGPVFAERIIEERNRQPFMSVEELKRVSGIADKRLNAIRPFITAP